MEGEIILKGIGLLIVGVLFICFGIMGWRQRREERISLIEAAILRAADQEPLPRTKWDQVFAYIQPILMLIFGPLMVLGEIAILLLLGEKP